jgi:formylglycine-generating enzyme required for sulfatase activity
LPISPDLRSPRVLRDRLKDGSEGPEMVFIQGGRFLMGSPESEAEQSSSELQHPVSIGDVWIGRYAVTFDEYDRFARAMGRDLPNDQGWGRGRRPVINVNWDDATAYAEWLSQQTRQQYRLPTEAEWEYAARAGTTTARYWGEAIGRNQANCRGCGSRWDGRQTAPVGSFAPNAWGLYDMLGNVWEWTCSSFDSNYGGGEQRCDRSGRDPVFRGGSWDIGPDWVRSAARYGSSPVLRNYYQGLRLARSP